MPCLVIPRNTMKSVSRTCLTEPFQIQQNAPVPVVPYNGAKVQVRFAGICYTQSQIFNSGRTRAKLDGIQDGSLYPGYEVSGILHEIASGIYGNQYHVGDRVIIFPEKTAHEGECLAEFVTVKDVTNLVKVPDTLPMDVAAMLPCGGLRAFATLEWLKPQIKMMIDDREGDCPVNVLINGAGTLGLWTLSIAKYMLSNDPSQLRLSIADTSVDKLEAAKQYGSKHVIHWDTSLYEEYMIERTRSVCSNGVDVIIDFPSTPRTLSRSFKVLAENGILVTGGHSGYDYNLNMPALAEKQQTVKGVSKGKKRQLEKLVDVVASGEVKAPDVQVYPVEQINDVFERMNECRISSRPVLSLSSL